jgi:hypothetical protein
MGIGSSLSFLKLRIQNIHSFIHLMGSRHIRCPALPRLPLGLDMQTA